MAILTVDSDWSSPIAVTAGDVIYNYEDAVLVSTDAAPEQIDGFALSKGQGFQFPADANIRVRAHSGSNLLISLTTF